MSHQKLLTKLEGFRSRNSQNHCYINKDVYRLLYDRDFYYIAYNSIKSNDGAETAGSDGTSLHGFCEEWIDELISSFRDEAISPSPTELLTSPRRMGKCVSLAFPMERTSWYRNVFTSYSNVSMNLHSQTFPMASVPIAVYIVRWLKLKPGALRSGSLRVTSLHVLTKSTIVF